ncbi:hypothetical protein JCM19237_4401 [Photobacterium aphoticum]|uniref:Uncharacterized protein n=1 Tax=Photobacterium aphoticum TaxID=754436 RepID=A0A090QPG2_9GAMM|nr:hypothetical protein JCM19237_4401 [Photobacterium aphoticum]
MGWKVAINTSYAMKSGRNRGWSLVTVLAFYYLIGHKLT